MHLKNSIDTLASQELVTALVGFCDTPIDNRGIQLLHVTSGANAEDALRTAKVLSSGLGQICRHMHDSLNMGELAYCDGMAALGFLAETVSALIWSVEKGVATAAGPGGEQ